MQAQEESVANVEPTTQFNLLRTRRLCPLFITQFGGAFNDNLFKAALVLSFTYSGIVAEEDINLVNNLALVLFILPLFLFSATAGTIADTFEKSALIRKVKIAEIAISILIGIALYMQNVGLLLFVLFLLGLQSTFFGPLKFSILPQHLHESELVGGNAVIEMGTFVAILLGTLIGTYLGGIESTALYLTGGVVVVSVVGYLTSLLIPKAPAHEGQEPIWNPIKAMSSLYKVVTRKRAVFLSVLGISWFWTIGSVYLTQVANLTRLHLAGGERVVIILLAVFTVSIALGSLVCERLSGRRIEIGLVPIGALGITIFGIDVWFAIQAIEGTGLRGIQEFLFGTGTFRFLFDLWCLGFFSGLFVVPMQALIQLRTPLESRARVIAANNILNSLCIVIGAVISTVWLTLLDFDIPSLLLLFAILNAAVAIFIFHEVPEFSMRFIIWVVTHTMYRVRHDGLDRIPNSGPCVIVCNHVSYVDALIMAGSVRRPIRFIMASNIFAFPILNFVFRTGRTIPIAPRRTDPETYENAFETIHEGLESGDLLCIFPEGKLTSDGEIDAFQPGIEKIVARDPVPVLPMALRGLWGSFFSLKGGKFSKPTRFWSRIELVVGNLIQPHEVNRSLLQDKVAELRGQRR